MQFASIVGGDQPISLPIVFTENFVLLLNNPAFLAPLVITSAILYNELCDVSAIIFCLSLLKSQWTSGIMLVLPAYFKLWWACIEAFVNMINPLAKSHLCHCKNEKRAYDECVWNIEYGTFTSVAYVNFLISNWVPCMLLGFHAAN